MAPSRWESSSAFLISDRRLRQGEGMIPVKSLVARGLIAFSPGIFIFFGVKNMCDSFILAVQQEQLSAQVGGGMGVICVGCSTRQIGRAHV